MGVRGRFAAAFIAAATLVAALAVGAPAEAGLAAGPSIRGTVTTAEGKPVAGATVGAYLATDGWSPTSITTTGADGTYTLADVGVGDNRVVVVPPTGSGLALRWYGAATGRGTATPIDVAAFEMVEGIDVSLPWSASIAGTVTDTGGDPVAGVAVWAYRATDLWTGSAVATTAADGTYTITGITADDYRVRAVPTLASDLVPGWHGGLPPAVVPVADQEDVTGIDVVVRAQATVSGTITDIGGAPVAGATVRAYRTGQFWFASATATTASDGTYTLERLVAGDHQLLVTPPPGSGLANQWFGPAAIRTGATTITLADGDDHAGADVVLPLDFPYEGTIDLDVDHPERCDVIAVDCLLPFPNDRFTVADPSTPTGRRVALDQASMPANAGGVHIDPEHWNELDGFSPGAAALLRFADVDLDASGVGPLTDLDVSLGADSPIVLLDGDTGERLAHWAELDTHAEPGAVPTLAVHPATALPEGRRIVVGVRDLVTTTGDPIEPTDGFRAFRDRLRTDVGPVEARRASMEQVFSDLAGAGVPRDDLIVAWDFTVASTEALSGRLLHMRDDAFARIGDDAPAFTVTSNTASTRTGIAREVIGTYQVPMYLSGTGQPGSELVLGPDGLPTFTGTYTARFRCIVPASASATNQATTGLYGHGLLGTYDQIGAARAVAVDGNRVFCGTDLIGMAEEDVLNAVSIVQDVSSFNTLADRLQQGHLNTLVLGRLLVHPDGFASDPAFQDGGAPLIDGEVPDVGLVYYGISQGGIMGAATTAVAQDWKLAMLDVPGSNYSLLLDRSVDFDPFRSIMTPAYPAAADRALGLQLIQMLWDRGEANGYIQHLTNDPYPHTPPHQVLLHAAFGDHQVANVSTAIEARTIGVAAVRPALAPGRSAEKDVFWGIPTINSYPYNGSAVVMWDSGADPPPLFNQPPRTGDDPHDNNRRTPAAINQIVTFFATRTVIDVCAGSPCAALP